MRNFFLGILLLLTGGTVSAQIVFPGKTPGPAAAEKQDDRFVLQNDTIAAAWAVEDGSLRLVDVEDRLHQRGYEALDAEPFSIEINGKPTPCSAMTLVAGPEISDKTPETGVARLSASLPGKEITATLRDPAGAVEVSWKAILCDGSNYIRQQIEIRSLAEKTQLGRITMLDLPMADGRVVGTVQGSPAAAGHLFLAMEHPIANSRVGGPLQWSPAMLTPDGSPKTIEFDLTPFIHAAGKYEIVFQYQHGAHRLDVSKVVLLQDEKPVATDEHHGFTGNAKQDNHYVVELPVYDPAAQYQLAVDAFTGYPGSDSFGEISLFHEGKPVETPKTVVCALDGLRTLDQGRSRTFSSVIGVVPEGQLRRGFLYYLERERAHPYRPFLHYNSWYDLNIGRPDSHMTEAEAMDALRLLGRELVEKRGVKLDAFVWDDGWDDFHSLWGFHQDFPNGFQKLAEEGARYGAGQGVWMSPWGGYGNTKEQRLEYGKSQGFEINPHGYSMAGEKYSAAFRDVCLEMMRRQGVVFFKFDGMGMGNSGGAQGSWGDDVDAVLRLTETLRRENPDLYISATVGTWASPFWTFFADSIWRQGDDVGFHGPGSRRRQWITYRDMFVYRRNVQAGPLYPLNSIMFHGLCIGPRAAPGQMERDEATVIEEIWMMFGCGMDLQELYITPSLLTPSMWDELAKAAKWSRANAATLVDSHWVGGDPGAGEVYGYASWSPRTGILVLRNPAEEPQSIELSAAEALELPPGAPKAFSLEDVRRPDRPALHWEADSPRRFELQPFEVRVFQARPEK